MRLLSKVCWSKKPWAGQAIGYNLTNARRLGSILLSTRGHSELTKSLLESFEAAQQITESTTRRAQSRAFRRAAEAVTYGKMGIDADAVQLYGDKVPEPDDNLLNGFLGSLNGRAAELVVETHWGL